MITTLSLGRHMHWYVNVENQAYGPYSDDQMRSFVAEGRITTASLISNAPENGYYGAGDFDAFNLWCGANQEELQPIVAVGGQVGAVSQYAPVQAVQPVTQSPAAQSNGQAATVSIPSQTTPQNIAGAKSGVFLIMAEIRSEGEMAFLRAMQGFGQVERIGDTVWLLRSAHSVEQIRNHLSQTLDQQDRLFILDSSAGKTAWFNIGADIDHRIRELWDEDKG